MYQVCRSCLRAIASKRLVYHSVIYPISIQAIVSRARWSSTVPATGTPKRPSPYRLIPISTFLADFAPLHVQGWRLETLPDASPTQEKESGMAQLQGRRLVRRYDFEQGKDGWRRLMSFTQKVGEAIETEDHHPTILISPSSDYRPPPNESASTSTSTPIPDTTGYVLSISTHTHTPLPPLKYPKSADGSQDTMRPGVTGKDLKLANRLEEIYQSMMNGTT